MNYYTESAHYPSTFKARLDQEVGVVKRDKCDHWLVFRTLRSAVSAARRCRNSKARNPKDESRTPGMRERGFNILGIRLLALGLFSTKRYR